MTHYNTTTKQHRQHDTIHSRNTTQHHRKFLNVHCNILCKLNPNKSDRIILTKNNKNYTYTPTQIHSDRFFFFSFQSCFPLRWWWLMFSVLLAESCVLHLSAGHFML